MNKNISKPLQLKAWGNSYGVRIPKHVLDEMNIPLDTEFDLICDKDTKTITLQVSDMLTPYQRLIACNLENNQLSKPPRMKSL